MANQLNAYRAKELVELLVSASQIVPQLGLHPVEELDLDEYLTKARLLITGKLILHRKKELTNG